MDDQYYWETYWDIWDYENETFLQYPSWSYEYANQSYTVGLVLPPGEYGFFMYESYGDGSISGSITDSDGNTLAQWNATQHASGIYFVEFVAGEKRDVQKLILLK